MKAPVLLVLFIGFLGISFGDDDKILDDLNFFDLHFHGISIANVATINNDVTNFDVDRFMSHDAMAGHKVSLTPPSKSYVNLYEILDDLNFPHLHFHGIFIANVAMINNDVTNFDMDEIPVDPYMSYLNFPHLHFHGIFTANVATINNDVKNFDVISLCHMMPWKDEIPDDPYMSYLNFPHLHFYGMFIANVATINNDVDNFDMDKFMSHDALAVYKGGRGMWNPKGTNDFSLKDTYVTNVCYLNGKCVSDKKKDIICGKSVTDGGYGSFAKFVDIDPQGQVVPAIWGLKIKIPGFFEADMVQTPLQAFWSRQANIPGDTGKGGLYQTILRNIKWGERAEQSPFIRQIRQVMHKVGSQELSIKFFMDLYHMRHRKKEFTQGRFIGSLGVSGPKAPSVATWGRCMVSNFIKQANAAPFIIDKVHKRLIIDFENSVPLDNHGLPMKANGKTWNVAYPRRQLHNISCSTEIEVIGSVNLEDSYWFEKLAGIKWFPLTKKQIDDLENTPLLFVMFNDTYDKGNTSNCIRVLLQEPSDGIFFRPYHDWVHRKDAGEHIRQNVFVTKFGKPYADAKIDLMATTKVFSTSVPTGVPKLPIPNTSVKSGKDGIAEIIMETIDPDNSRKIIDGQVYCHVFGVNGSELHKIHLKAFKSNNPDDLYPVLDFVFLTRVYNNYTVHEPITWVDHVYPIFHQYAYLFPVMRSNTFKMDSYFDVVSHKKITSLSLGLPITHPSFMPATRDLSKKKRKVLLDWLSKENPPIGDVTKLLTVRYLKERLYTANEIIHASIPMYLTAMWSLKPGYNTEIQSILTRSIKQSFLHLGLISNVLTSVGGEVRFHYESFTAKFPSELNGGIQPSLILSVEKFSKPFLKNVLLHMKRPDYDILDVGFREVLFDHERSYRSLCVNKSNDASSEEICDNSKQHYKYHLSYCRRAVKEYLLKSIKSSDPTILKLDSYIDPRDKNFFNYHASIGKLYDHILLIFAKLTDCGTNNTLFSKIPCTAKNNVTSLCQIHSDLFNATSLTNVSFLEMLEKKIFSIKSYFDVVKAIRLILNDNQGITPCDPRAQKPSEYTHDIEGNEPPEDMSHFSQYAMLMAVYKGHAPVVGRSSNDLSNWSGLKTGDKKYAEKICNGKLYEFKGKEIPFNESAVWPIISNPPPSFLHTENSSVSKISELFNKLYTGFLYALERVLQYNKHNLISINHAIRFKQKFLNRAQKFLWAADHYARKLVQMPLNKEGDPNIGPNSAPSYHHNLIPYKVLKIYTKSLDTLIKFNFNLTAARYYLNHTIFAKKLNHSGSQKEYKVSKEILERYHLKNGQLYDEGKPENIKHSDQIHQELAKNKVHIYPGDSEEPGDNKFDNPHSDPEYIQVVDNIKYEDPIESILRPVEDPLESVFKRKKRAKFYNSWDDFENDSDLKVKNTGPQDTNEQLKRGAEPNEDYMEEEDDIILNISTLLSD